MDYLKLAADLARIHAEELSPVVTPANPFGRIGYGIACCDRCGEYERDCQCKGVDTCDWSGNRGPV